MELYSQNSGKLGLICFAIWVIMLIRGRNVFNGKSIWSDNYWFVFGGMLLFSVLGFLEWDTYNYYGLYQQTKEAGVGIHFEPVYVWLIRVLPNSYFLFRLVVWGLSCVLTVLSFKRLNLNANVLAMTVPLLLLVVLAGTRGVLGFSLMTYCSIMFVQSMEKRKLFPVLLAVAGIILSAFFHRSMFIFIILLVVAYLAPMNKRVFIISLIAFPFLYGIVYTYFTDFSLFENLLEEQVDLIETYQNQEFQESNINGIINIVFSKTILLLLVFIIVRKYLYQKVEVPKENFLMFKFAYIAIYVSFLFLREDVSNWVSIRTLHAGTFGLLMCATYCLDAKSLGCKRTILEQVVLLGYFLIVLWRHYSFMRQFWN